MPVCPSCQGFGRHYAPNASMVCINCGGSGSVSAGGGGGAGGGGAIPLELILALGAGGWATFYYNTRVESLEELGIRVALVVFAVWLTGFLLGKFLVRTWIGRWIARILLFSALAYGIIWAVRACGPGGG